MGEWNFIGDVHGDMGALKKLTAKMPKAPFFSVGDIIDRGLRSKEVIEFFIHGHLRTDRPKKYSTFGAGIDTWRGKDSILTGFHWPSKKMYTVNV